MKLLNALSVLLIQKVTIDPGDFDLGPSLREICAANRSDEKQVLFDVVNWCSPLPFVLTLYWFYHTVTSIST